MIVVAFYTNNKAKDIIFVFQLVKININDMHHSWGLWQVSDCYRSSKYYTNSKTPTPHWPVLDQKRMGRGKITEQFCMMLYITVTILEIWTA